MTTKTSPVQDRWPGVRLPETGQLEWERQMLTAELARLRAVNDELLAVLGELVHDIELHHAVSGAVSIYLDKARAAIARNKE